MNRIHRTVWNQHRGAFVAVAETTRSHGRGASVSGSLLASVLLGAGLAGTAFADPPAPAAGPGAAAPTSTASTASMSARPAPLATTALPNGGQVTAGQASMERSGSALTIHQTSTKTAIDWRSFSIGKDASVQFVQPSAAAVALNRVTGTEGSVIDGALTANGQVFVLNPNGVLFGKNAQVDTAGLVATTLQLSNADFLAGRTTFGNDPAGTRRGAAVVNQGSLTARDGGYVVLMGSQVRNDGVISARLGTVALAAGEKVSLNFNGDSLVGVVVDAGALDALVANGNAVRADGGLVLLTAKGAEGLLNTVVNNTGEIRAQTIENKAGRIYLLGDGGAVEVAGMLDASAPAGGAGGFIETSGRVLNVADGTRVTSLAAADKTGHAGKNGQWLIDPIDFYITAGSAGASTSSIGAATLQTALGAGNVTIQTQASGSEVGNINVNAPVAWSANALTLEAHGDINVNAVMSASGTSSLDLKTGYNFNSGAPTFNTANSVRMQLDVAANGTPSFSGRIDFVTTAGGTTGRTGTGALTINNQAYTLVGALGAAGAQTSAGNFNLQGLAHSSNAAGRFALAYDINAAATSTWNAGAGFVPIGSTATPFSGMFQGLGHSISGLALNRGGSEANGLFGRVANGSSVASGTVIQGIGLTNPSVVGNATGTLVGRLGAATVRNAWASGGSVAGDGRIGGLIGWTEGSVIAEVAARVAVNLNNDNGSAPYNGINGEAGGLVGLADAGTSVTRAMAAGNLDMGSDSLGAGGMFGRLAGSSTVSLSYALGNLSARGGTSSFGGFVGIADNSSITDAYSRGTVSPSASFQMNLGGFAGESNASTINRVYAAAPVSGLFVFGGQGGLVGSQSGGSITNSFWDSSIAGGGNANGIGTSRTTAQMTSNSTFTAAGWNFALGSGTWARRDDVNNKYPVLRAFGYTDRLAQANVDPAFFAGPTAALNYSTSGLLNGDALVLTQAGNTLTGALANPARAGFYDGIQVRSQATTGNLTVNRPVSWSNFNLALEAAGDINVNAVMSATGNATLDLRTGYNFDASAPAFDATKTVRTGFNNDRSFAGRVDFNRTGTGILSINNQGYTLINALGSAGSTNGADLQGMGGALNGRFALAADINAAATSGWNGGAGFAPVGTSGANFTGTLDGLGHVVSGLTINRPSASAVGLIGYASPSPAGTVARNLGLTSASVAGGSSTGLLLGVANTGSRINNVLMAGSVTSTGEKIGAIVGEAVDVDISIGMSSGTVTGAGSVGGLVGYAAGLTLNASSSSSTVTGSGASGYVGGAVGHALTQTITDTSSTGSVTTAGPHAGGLVGAAGGGSITSSQASGAVTSTSTGPGPVAVGGLVGTNAGSITTSAASGNVSGSGAGGLVGMSSSSGSISRSQASGAVSGVSWLGGLVGINEGSINTSFATGTVTGANYVGGFAGVNLDGSISDSYAMGSVAGDQYVGGLVAVNNGGTIARGYSAGAVTGNNGVGGLVGFAIRSATTTNSFWDVQTSGLGTADATAGSAGGTGKSTADMNSTALFTGAGWDFTFGSGVWGRKDSVNNKYPVLRTFGYTDPLTLNLASAGKTYGDANPALGSFTVTGCPTVTCVTAVSLGSAIGLSTGVGTYAFDASNVLNLSFAGGYSASQFELVVPSAAFSITPRVLTVAAAGGATRSYDASAIVSASLLGAGNVVNGDTVTLSGTATLAGRDVGSRAISSISALSQSNANYTLVGATASGTVAITPATLGVAASTGATRVYDRSTAADASLFLVSGLLGGDSTTLSGAAVLAAANAGAQSVAGIGTLAASNTNYVLATTAPGGTVAITPATLGLAAATGAARVYDRSTAADASLFQVSGLLGSDTTTLAGTAVLNGANAGNQGVAGLGTLAVANANYVLATFAPSGTVAITPATLAVATSPGATRVYDRTLGADAGLFQLSGLLGGDTTTLSGSAVLAGMNVGTQGVAGLGTLVSANANYVLANTAPSGTVAVTPATLTAATATGATRVYDRSTAAGASLFQINGLLTGDSTALSGNAVLASANAGTRGVVGAGTLAVSNGNYVLSSAAPTGTVAITPAALAVAARSGAMRIYDRSNSAGSSLFQVSGLLGSDTTSLSGDATLAAAGVGTQAVTGMGTLAVANPNYMLSGGSPAGSVAITPATLAVSAVPGATRVYDRSTVAGAGLFRVSGLLGSDTTALAGSAVLAGPNAGLQTVAGIGTLSNTNANYVLASAPPAGSVAITPRSVQVSSAMTASKVYDGSAAFGVDQLNLSGVLGSDVVGIVGTATLAGSNVGRYAYSLENAGLTNANYTLLGTTPVGTVAVGPRVVSLATVAGATQVYNGGTAVVPEQLVLGNLVAGDRVRLAGRGALASRNVGNQAVLTGALTLDNANYTLDEVGISGQVAVTPRPVSVAGVGSRVYDGTTAAAASLLQVTNVVAGDSLALGGSAMLASGNVGAQTFGPGSLSLSNGNYTLVGMTSTGTVTITARPVAVTAVSGANRMYDATTNLSASQLQVSGVLGNDTVRLLGNATLNSRDVGAQGVLVGALVLDNTNYTLAGVIPSGSVNVTPRPVTLAAVSGAARVYDGSANAVAALLQAGNVMAGDSAGLAGVAALDSKDVGARSVGLGSLVLSNGNYTLAGVTPTGTVTVTARPLAVAALEGASRMYDASTIAAADLLQLTGVLVGDEVQLGGSATLASPRAGAQAISAGSLRLSSGNYTLNGVVPTGTVTITPRTLNLTFSVADKVFDGSTAAVVSASDNRVAGDVLRVDVSGAFADTAVGNAKPVTITAVSLAGADAGNYRVASTTEAAPRGNLLARSVTYTLAAQDPGRTYTASGQMLVSAAELDTLVAATFANTVAGTAPGALSYTLWRDGQQVSGLRDAGVYEIRASFAAADAHYALAETGNTVLRLNVSSRSTELQSTIAEAVRTEVPASATASVYASTTAPRPLAEFNPVPPNVAVAPPAITSAFGVGTPLSIVSSPSEKEPSEGVSLTQARRMVAASNSENGNRAGNRQAGDAGAREVRVPVSRNSLAEIVNGGVKLPGGVDQLLFVIKAGQ